MIWRSEAAVLVVMPRPLFEPMAEAIAPASLVAATASPIWTAPQNPAIAPPENPAVRRAVLTAVPTPGINSSAASPATSAAPAIALLIMPGPQRLRRSEERRVGKE